MADYSRKNIEDIKVGDFVMGIDGSPQEVIKTNSGTDQLYLIKQLKGEDYVVNTSHPLYLEWKSKKSKKILITAPEVLDLSKKQYNKFYSIKSYAHNYYKDNLWIDPYFYGLWLGDGFNQWAGIVVNCDKDPEIKEFIEKYFN